MRSSDNTSHNILHDSDKISTNDAGYATRQQVREQSLQYIPPMIDKDIAIITQLEKNYSTAVTLLENGNVHWNWAMTYPWIFVHHGPFMKKEESAQLRGEYGLTKKHLSRWRAYHNGQKFIEDTATVQFLAHWAKTYCKVERIPESNCKPLEQYMYLLLMISDAEFVSQIWDELYNASDLGISLSRWHQALSALNDSAQRFTRYSNWYSTDIANFVHLARTHIYNNTPVSSLTRLRIYELHYSKFTKDVERAEESRREIVEQIDALNSDNLAMHARLQNKLARVEKCINEAQAMRCNLYLKIEYLLSRDHGSLENEALFQSIRQWLQDLKNAYFDPKQFYYSYPVRAVQISPSWIPTQYIAPRIAPKKPLSINTALSFHL